MASWIDRYRDDRSLDILSRELFSHRTAASGSWSVIKSVVKAIKSGLAAGAVIAALAAAGYAGKSWEKVVERVSSEIGSGKWDDANISSIAKEELGWGTLDIPSGHPRESAASPRRDAPDSSMFFYISNHEGRGEKPGWRYFDSKEKPTIGVGHLMGNDRSRRAFGELFGDSVDYDEVLAGRASLSEDQEMALFNYDARDKLATARRIIRNFDRLEQRTRNAIVDAIFRGDLGPKTIALMNAGKWREASSEYLDYKEYRNTKAALKAGVKTKSPGIVPRMEQNAAAFMAQERL